MSIATSPIDALIAKLDQGGYEPRSTGPDSYESRCPGHEGSRRNLTITVKSDGTVLLKCHHEPSCGAEAILSPLGMKLRDLFPQSDQFKNNGHSKASKPRATKKPKKAHESASKAIDALLWLENQGDDKTWRLVQWWNYPDRAGTVIMRVARFENAVGDKKYGPAHRATDRWFVGDPPGRLPLYHLDELADAPVIWVLEGEKCADLARDLGLFTTTTAHGAGSPHKSDLSPLAGKTLYLAPDHDDEGENYVGKLASLASTLTPPPRIKIVRLPLHEKGDDIEQWLESLPVEWNAERRRQELERLADEAPIWEQERVAPEPGSNGDGHAPSGGEKPTATRPRRFNLTDLGNAERLVSRHGTILRYVHPWRKWLVNDDGVRWMIDSTAAVRYMARQTVRSIYEEAAGETDDDRRKFLVKHGQASEQRDRLAAMMSLAEAEKDIPIEPNKLDRDPWLLNVPNGTLDLRTGRLRPHRREDLITKLCPVPYNPDAECPIWEKTLERLFNGHSELIAFLRRLFGYSLSGDVSEQVLPILHGTGANGKSTVMGVLLTMLGGDYAMKAPQSFLMVGKHERHPTELADLFGKRVVVAIETGEGARINETLIKELTGGDPIRARRMREDFWEFLPTHKVMLCTNHKPTVKGTDHAIWRRLKLIPFEVRIPDEEQDKQLPQKLAKELPGILTWCVQGCREWQESGLNPPQEVTDATQEYRAEEDVLQAFMDECCMTGNRQFRAKATPLYDRYRKWTEGSGEVPVPQRRFGQALTERGFRRYTNNGTWYEGIGLRQSDEDSDGPAF